MRGTKPADCARVAGPGSLCVAVPVLARVLLAVATSHLAAIAAPDAARVLRAIFTSSSLRSTVWVVASI